MRMHPVDIHFSGRSIDPTISFTASNDSTFLQICPVSDELKIRFHCSCCVLISLFLQTHWTVNRVRELCAWVVAAASIWMDRFFVGWKCSSAARRASSCTWWTRLLSALNAKWKSSQTYWAIEAGAPEPAAKFLISAARTVSPSSISNRFTISTTATVAIRWTWLRLMTFGTMLSNMVNQIGSTCLCHVNHFIFLFRFGQRSAVWALSKTFRLRRRRCDFISSKWHHNLLLLEHMHDGCVRFL